MKYLQDNKDKSMLIDKQLDMSLTRSLSVSLYIHVSNNHEHNTLFSKLNSRISTILQLDLNLYNWI